MTEIENRKERNLYRKSNIHDLFVFLRVENF